VLLAHAPGYELAVLGAEIENSYPVPCFHGAGKLSEAFAQCQFSVYGVEFELGGGWSVLAEYVVAHFGVRLSRQFAASSSLSQAARTVVQRHLRNPEICANLTQNSPARRNAQQGLPHWAGLRPDPMYLMDDSLLRKIGCTG
jgi:hypothetical protein